MEDTTTATERRVDVPTIVTITLRQTCPQTDPGGDILEDQDGQTLYHYPAPEEVDLDRLSPRARALAEAVAATMSRDAGPVALESDQPIRERIPNWEEIYSPENADRHMHTEFRAWDRWPADRAGDPHDYLERHAAKIPAGWHPVQRQWPHYQPIPQDTRMTVQQVVETLGQHGIRIKPGTWRAYVARGQAPQPAGRVGSTPVWDPAEIVGYLRDRPGQGARTDLSE